MYQFPMSRGISSLWQKVGILLSMHTKIDRFFDSVLEFYEIGQNHSKSVAQFQFVFGK